MSSKAVNFTQLFVSFLVVLLLVYPMTAYAAPPALRFRPDGTFKVMQVTDVHLSFKEKDPQRSVALLAQMLDTERPDLLVFTGDLVYCDSVQRLWAMLLAPVLQRAQPWVAIFGNHDAEFDQSNAQQMAYLRAQPYCLIPDDPQGVPGVGNYALPVLDAQADTVVRMLYFLDSHALAPDAAWGKYDWVKAAQIDWYRRQSLQQGGKPALLFLHIPLPEYAQAAKAPLRTGHKGEKVCSPEVNSGLFAAMLDQGDVMGAFAGHDHENDYVGILQGIALGYGRVSGYQAYGHPERGVRLLRLHAGQRAFDTWIRTPKGMANPFCYPQGRRELLTPWQGAQLVKVP